MRTNRTWDNRIYRIADFLSAMFAWAIFFGYRNWIELGRWDWSQYNDPNFFLGIIMVPSGWLLFYFIFDKYGDIYRLSRLSTLVRTFLLSLAGVGILFFTLLLDDVVHQQTSLIQSFLVLFALHFTLTVVVRMVLLTRASRRLKRGDVGFKTLIIGGDIKAMDLYRELTQHSPGLGHKFIGFVTVEQEDHPLLEKQLAYLGTIESLSGTVEHYGIEEVIIAVETSEHNILEYILNVLFDYEDKVLVKIIPDMYDIMLGIVKMTHVYGAILIEIEQDLMPRWQRVIKRIMDVVISILFLLILSPLLLYVILRVRLSSPGPIFFRQKRVGLRGEPFTIYKFRSMYQDAEKDGPQLSSTNDDRITPWGAVMRKWRIDEIPQFWNVVKGEMSLVGPRPEREHYIQKILQRAPHYKHLLKVRPGITSWGQVKYGYASSVDEMIQRLKYDILYIENMSLALDFKILFYTVLVLFQGKGK